MKIAQVVTYVSVDGAFGGPVAVAVAQCAELARLGHDVELLAGWDGVASIVIPGVKVRLFPVKRILPGGFSGLLAPSLQRYMRRHGGAFDVVHVHLARDLISLPAARSATRRLQILVVQTHGMVMPDTRTKSRIFDTLLMRTVLRRADTVLALTAEESVGIVSITDHHENVHRITNGVDLQSAPIRPEHAQEVPPEVLFLARLHPRKRVMAFAQMAKLLILRGTRATFHVVGPDEGDLAELLRFINDEGLSASIIYEGSIASGAAPTRLARAAVYVLPSFGEIVPMTVLEAMSVGTPVVLTNDCGMADQLRQRAAAWVTDGSAEELEAAVALLLGDGSRRGALAYEARCTLAEVFSIEAVGIRLLAHYAPAAASDVVSFSPARLNSDPR